MPLLGAAAMLLSFDVAADAIDEHDRWHTHEHLPERLSIPGFLRGTRWVAVRGQPRYFVLYEVAQLATLTSDTYRARLDNPTPWTRKMMPHYRGMSRGLCTVSASVGLGIGGVCTLVRFKPAREAPAPLRQWLMQDALPQLAASSGLGSAHLLEGAATPAMTNEQRIRGQDAAVNWALVITGYDSGALERSVGNSVGASQLTARGATEVQQATYRVDYSLTRDEVAASPAPG
jgi:hypothetical protein